ncbi:MAG: putative rane protein [Ilumatobacteraceae bacterium]|nr:putative rane protein [Ilumatobacteraceae bacterium]
MTRRPDRGEASAQIVVLTPLLILLVLLGVQSAIWFHAANVASAAASQGAAAGAPLGAGAAAAQDAASQTLHDLGSTGSPSATATAELVTVVVRVSVPRIVPFFPDSVERTAVEPKERFVPESDR